LRFAFREVDRAIWDATEGRDAVAIMDGRRTLDLGVSGAHAVQALVHASKSAVHAMRMLRVTDGRSRGVKVIEESEKLADTNCRVAEEFGGNSVITPGKSAPCSCAGPCIYPLGVLDEAGRSTPSPDYSLQSGASP
jgi:hypothetical protein